MTVQQLYYFSAVVSQGSFQQAAAHCHITQPALSMLIRKLEQELEIDLLDRSVQPIVPTAAGKKLLEQARLVLREMQRFGELAQEIRGEQSGELRVGIIPTLAPYLLPLMLEKFSKTFPHVQLVVNEMTSAAIVDSILHEKIDCGLLATPFDSGKLLVQPLFSEPFVAYVSRKHPAFKKSTLQAVDIPADELLLMAEGHCLRSQALQLCSSTDKNTKSPLRYESGSIETLRRLVEQGRGLTILPELAVSTLSTKQKTMVRYFRSPEPSRQISLLTVKNYTRKPLIDGLATLITEAVPNRMKPSAKKKIIDAR
jgi:LysR family hydrogen peroxide-inducible transcriptional activator